MPVKQHEEGRLVSAVLPEEDDADDCDYLDVHDGQQSLRLSGVGCCVRGVEDGTLLGPAVGPWHRERP